MRAFGVMAQVSGVLDVCFTCIVWHPSCLLQREIILISTEIKARYACDAQKIFKNNNSQAGGWGLLINLS